MWSGWVVCLSEVLGALALVGLARVTNRHGRRGLMAPPSGALSRRPYPSWQPIREPSDGWDSPALVEPYLTLT